MGKGEMVHSLTYIYQETKDNEELENGWELWGKRITAEEEVFVYRKLVALEEAEQYYLEQELLN